MTPPHRNENILLIGMGLLLLFHVAFHVSPLWRLSYLIHFAPMMALLGVVCFLNAGLLLGWRNASVFLGIAVVLGWSAEQFGVKTGWIFGNYQYGDKLGPKLGEVPVVIPIAWFLVTYLGTVIANVIIHRAPVARETRLRNIFVMAIATCMCATAYDMAMDPAMSHPEVLAWEWLDGGAYLGVPFHNYRGWVVVSFTIAILYRLYERERPARPITKRPRLVATVAWLAYASLGLGFIMIGKPVASQLVTVFAMGIPVLLAGVALFHGPYEDGRAVPAGESVPGN